MPVMHGYHGMHTGPQLRFPYMSCLYQNMSFLTYGSREVQFTARRPFPHAEGQLRMRANVLRVRRASSACGRTFSACGEIAPHAEQGLRTPRSAPPHAEQGLRTPRNAPPHAEVRLRTPRSASPHYDNWGDISR